jgi:hypothetical protein
MMKNDMPPDELRAIFEAHFPVPVGVYWDGDHFAGHRDHIASFRNASEWDAMYRGFRAAAKEFGHAG